MKRHTVILPIRFPSLTDRAAAQLVELLHELIGAIDYHYAEQAHRYHKRQGEIHTPRQSTFPNNHDLPF
jgi:hypothetical protein